MAARMDNPAMVVPDAMPALLAVGKAVQGTGVDPETIEMTHLRVSQINGCSVCVDGHARALRKGGISDERLAAVAAWRDAPYFTDAERAALALAEAATRISDRAEQVPDKVWKEAATHYDDKALAGLTLSIGLVNLWNRVNITTGQVAGAAEW